MSVSRNPLCQSVNYLLEDDATLGALPENWNRAVTSNDRVYFVDHNTQTTTWIDPRTKSFRWIQKEKCRPGELPYGWDELFDDMVGVYYVDLINRETTFTPPWDKSKAGYSIPRKTLAEEIDLTNQARVYQMFLRDQITRAEGELIELQANMEYSNDDSALAATSSRGIENASTSISPSSNTSHNQQSTTNNSAVFQRRELAKNTPTNFTRSDSVTSLINSRDIKGDNGRSYIATTMTASQCDPGSIVPKKMPHKLPTGPEQNYPLETSPFDAKVQKHQVI